MYLFTRKHTGCIAAAFGAACALALLPTPGFARIADETRSVAVHYSDLNLNTEAGASALYSRLVIAARNACDDPATIVDINQMRTIEECRKDALADAVYRVDSPLVTQAFEKRYPGQLFAASPARAAPAGAI